MKFSLPIATVLGLVTGALIPAADAQQARLPHASTTQPKPAAATTPPVIEDQALTLLKKNQEAMLALKSYAAECHTILKRDKPRAQKPNGEFKLSLLSAEKPNKMRYDSWELDGNPILNEWSKPTDAPTYIFACDGKDNYHQFGKMYRKDDRIEPERMSTILEPWIGFYTANNSVYGSVLEYRKQNQLREVRVTGQALVEGITCDKVFVHVLSSYNGQKYESSATWYIGADGLVRRCVDHVAFDDKPGVTRDATLTNIRFNEPIDTALYAYTPPKGVTLEQEEKPTPLLANGTIAPDFTAQGMDKKSVKLSGLRGKVVVIDFWASWCPPCNAAMPHNQTVMKKLKAEGLPVVMLAVDDGEGRDAFEAWVKQKQSSLSALTFVYVPQKEDVSGKQFKVTGIPTQYVLDKNGVIRASFVGFGGPTDDLEKAVRAALGKSATAKAATTAGRK